MNTTKYLAAAAAMLMLGAASAQAQTSTMDSYLPGFNLTLLGGWTSHPDLAIGGTHSNVDDGFNAGGRLEYDLGGTLSNFSLGADALHTESNYAGTATGARLNATSIMANLLYHLPTDSPFQIYGGGGVGVVHDNLDGTVHGSSTVFGWQAIGGVEYKLSDRTSLIAEYRYQNAHNANIGVAGQVGNTSNNLSFGVKFAL